MFAPYCTQYSTCISSTSHLTMHTVNAARGGNYIHITYRKGKYQHMQKHTYTCMSFANTIYTTTPAETAKGIHPTSKKTYELPTIQGNIQILGSLNGQLKHQSLQLRVMLSLGKRAWSSRGQPRYVLRRGSPLVMFDSVLATSGGIGNRMTGGGTRILSATVKAIKESVNYWVAISQPCTWANAN